MATKKKTEEVELATYLVQCRGQKNDFIIEIPKTWRVTFGYVNPSRSSDGYRQNEGHCLRVWEGEKLRGVWGDVVAFRDLSIPYALKVTKETGSAKWEKDSAGNFKSQNEVQVETKLLVEGDGNPF